MTDEDSILENIRYSNEKILILNVFSCACLPAIFNGGNSTIGLCVIFAAGILAIINVCTFPSNWIDAPEFTRVKYFAALSPYLAVLAFSIFRLSNPATVEFLEGEHVNIKFSELSGLCASSAYNDSYGAVSGCIPLVSSAASALSIPIITQSRFVLKKMIALCAIFISLLCAGGFIVEFFESISAHSIKWLFGRNAFSTFEYAPSFSTTSYIWGSMLLAAGIYTKQRFRLLSAVITPRSLFLFGGALMFAAAFFTAKDSFKPFIVAGGAIASAIYAIDTIPTLYNLKRHWDYDFYGEMPKRKITEVVFPIIFYSLVSVACVAFLAANFSDIASAFSDSPALAGINDDTRKIIEQKPLFGWGVNSFPTVFKFFQGDDIEFANWISPTTDVYRMLVDVGYAGIAALLITPAFMLIKTLAGIAFKVSYSGIIMLSAVLFVAISANFSNTLQNPAAMASFMVLFFTFIAWEDAEII
ncbi:MAG: hypothetical protein J6P03_00110 [Opitutales bacterium]|nr:hypothetical protein [Opitutales bacterium]